MTLKFPALVFADHTMNVFYFFINASCSGVALCEVGESLAQMSEIKDSLDISVKQNFIDPLQQLCDKDIKEVMVCFIRIGLQNFLAEE